MPAPGGGTMLTPHTISDATAAAASAANANTLAAAAATASVLAANAAATAAAKANAAATSGGAVPANSNPIRSQPLPSKPSEALPAQPHVSSTPQPHAQHPTKPPLSPAKDAASPHTRLSGPHADALHMPSHPSSNPKPPQSGAHVSSGASTATITTSNLTAEEQQRFHQKGMAALGTFMPTPSALSSHQPTHVHTLNDGAASGHHPASLHAWSRPSLPLHTSNSPHILTMADVATHSEAARNLHHVTPPHPSPASSVPSSADLAAADALSAHLATLARLTSNSRAHVHHLTQQQQAAQQQHVLPPNTSELHVGTGGPQHAAASSAPSAPAGQRTRQEAVPQGGHLMAPSDRPQQQQGGPASSTTPQSHQHLRHEQQPPQQRRFSTSDATQPSPQQGQGQPGPAATLSWGANEAAPPPSFTTPHPATTAAKSSVNPTAANVPVLTQHSVALPLTGTTLGTGKDNTHVLTSVQFPPAKQNSNGQQLPGYAADLQAKLVNLMQEIHKQQQQQRGTSAGATLSIPPYLPLPADMQKHILDALHSQHHLQHGRPASQPNPASSQQLQQQWPASSQSQSEGVPASAGGAGSVRQGDAELAAKEGKAQPLLQPSRIACVRPVDIGIPADSTALKATGVWGR